MAEGPTAKAIGTTEAAAEGMTHTVEKNRGFALSTGSSFSV
jgi:hypothetical protein